MLSAKGSPASTLFQIRTVLSSEAVAICAPSGLNTASSTLFAVPIQHREEFACLGVPNAGRLVF